MDRGVKEGWGWGTGFRDVDILDFEVEVWAFVDDDAGFACLGDFCCYLAHDCGAR